MYLCIAIATSLYHIEVSNFYLGTGHQKALLVILAVAVVFARSLPFDLKRLSTASTTTFLAVSSVAIVLFATIRNISE